MTPETLLLEANGWVPNNPRLPVILYRNVLAPTAPNETASNFERLFRDYASTAGDIGLYL
jgi:uncharacterized protein YjlB